MLGTVIWFVFLAFEHSYLLQHVNSVHVSTHAKIFSINYASYMLVSGCMFNTGLQLAFHVYSMCVWYHLGNYSQQEFIRHLIGMTISYTLGARHSLLQLLVHSLFTYSYTPFFTTLVDDRYTTTLTYARYISCGLTTMYTIATLTSIAMRVLIPLGMVAMFVL